MAVDQAYTRAYDKRDDDDVPFPTRGVPGGWRDWFDVDDCAAARAEHADLQRAIRRERARHLIATLNARRRHRQRSNRSRRAGRSADADPHRVP